MVKHRKKSKKVFADKINRGKGVSRLRKKKSYELTHFYRFQMREEKHAKLQDLRRKFEQDKLKVAGMKAERKFKPF